MVEMTMEEKLLRNWIGREEEAIDDIAPSTVRRVQAFFGLDANAEAGMVLPEVWHWCFFHQPAFADELGKDGHRRVGGFLPPIALPRRMWGGSRLLFERPIVVGRQTTRKSIVRSVDIKQGSAGPLGLVCVEHVFTQDGRTCLVEQQNLVYRPAASEGGTAAAPEAPSGPEASSYVDPDEVMLFRYSALSFNSHRIHYDRNYAVEEEHYPALVVHGPLTASYLALLAGSMRNGERMREFDFRATSPLFCGTRFGVHAKADDDGLMLWAETPQRRLAMKARARF